MPFAIQVDQLTKHFPRPKGYRDLLLRPFHQEYITALRGIDLRVEHGELFGLLGPNGAGKTTLIKILATLVWATSGQAWVNGHNVQRDGMRVRQSIGYVMSDERSFYWRLTGRQNLSFFAALNNLSPEQARRRVDETLSLVELTDQADVTFQNYSTGMRHRLAIARALLTQPDIMFLDEPTRSLDPGTAHTLRQFIRHDLVEAHGKTVLLATHNLSEAEALCDRLAIIDHGQVQVCGTLAEIRAKLTPPRRYTLRVQDGADLLATIVGQLPGVRLSAGDHSLTLDGATRMSDVISALVAGGVGLDACIPEELPLEDVFKQFTQDGGA
ncbi:MAG: ABC transporter ATP-binding protein [Thermoflexales bacterium]|nr:ABC transporter ATP-binding protein [Thermoflexales bacterium]